MQLELAFAYPTFGVIWVLLLVYTKPQPPIKEIFSFFYALFAALFAAAMSHLTLEYWYVIPILTALGLVGYRGYKVFQHSAKVSSQKRAHLK